MIQFLLAIFIIAILFYLIKNKVVFRIDTLFRKGFALKNDKHRRDVFLPVSRAIGKTYSVVDYLSNLAKDSTVIITNVKSYKNSKCNVIYENNFYEIIHRFETGQYNNNYVIFYDEIFTLLEKGKLDKSVLGFISQLRKRKIMLVTTAQEWLEINVTFRRYCRFQVDCRMVNLPIFNCAFSINEINDGYKMQWDNLQNEYIAPRLKTTIKKCSKKLADSYDTYEVIENVDPIGGKKYIEKRYKVM